MVSSILDVLCKAAEELFEPLAKLAMSEQIPANALAPVLEKAFIRAVEKEAEALRQPVPAISAVSARTGLSRPRVRQIRKCQSGRPLAATARPSQLLRVLESWRADSDFQDDEGEPKNLSQRGSGSFTELVRRQGAGLRPGAILTELLRIKAVRLTKQGHVEMLNRADIDAERRVQGIRDLGEFGSECLSTLVCRIMDPSTPNYYRRVVGLYIDKDEVPRLVRDASASAGVWAGGFQDAMSDKRVIVKPEATAKGAVRLAGHFLISERPTIVPANSEPLLRRSVAVGKRKGRRRRVE
jgi:hypothetical protein